MSIKLVHSIVAYFILKSSRDQGIKGLGHKFESCWAGQFHFGSYKSRLVDWLDIGLIIDELDWRWIHLGQAWWILADYQ